MPYKQIEVRIVFKGKNKDSPILECSDTAAKIAREISNRHTILWREEAFLLCLNTRNMLIGWYRIAIGGVDIVNIDSRIVGTIALKSTASGIILVHNHPSGDPKPSTNDIKSTIKLKQVMDIIGINFLDHIIITDHDHYSMKEQGIL